MLVKSSFLRNVATVVACLAVCAVMMSCSKDKDNGDDGTENGNGTENGLGVDKEPKLGNGNFGSTLTLKGQVYINTNSYPDPYKKWTGNATVYSEDFYGEDGFITGKITNGQLNFSVGQPRENIEYLSTLEGILCDAGQFNVPYHYDNVKVEPSGVKVFVLWGLTSEEYYGVYKENVTLSDEGMFQRFVIYFWVEKDVRLTAKGKIKDKYSSTEDIDLQFKAGWNALYKKQVWAENTPNLLKVADADLMWIIDLDND